MSQKTNPYAFRLGHNQNWNYLFFSKDKSSNIKILKINKVIEDFFKKNFLDFSKINIENKENSINVNAFFLNVNNLEDKDFDRLKKLVKQIKELMQVEKPSVKINLIEVKKIFCDANSIANYIGDQLQKRIKLRLVMRTVLNKIALERENKGVKIKVKGLIDGIGIAQTKKFLWGVISQNTLDNFITSGFKKVITARGVIGVTVYVNHNLNIIKKKYS